MDVNNLKKLELIISTLSNIITQKKRQYFDYYQQELIKLLGTIRKNDLSKDYLTFIQTFVDWDYERLVLFYGGI